MEPRAWAASGRWAGVGADGRVRVGAQMGRSRVRRVTRQRHSGRVADGSIGGSAAPTPRSGQIGLTSAAAAAVRSPRGRGRLDVRTRQVVRSLGTEPDQEPDAALEIEEIEDVVAS